MGKVCERNECGRKEITDQTTHYRYAVILQLPRVVWSHYFVSRYWVTLTVVSGVSPIPLNRTDPSQLPECPEQNRPKKCAPYKAEFRENFKIGRVNHHAHRQRVTKLLKLFVRLVISHIPSIIVWADA